jgi:hypothetical protein
MDILRIGFLLSFCRLWQYFRKWDWGFIPG